MDQPSGGKTWKGPLWHLQAFAPLGKNALGIGKRDFQRLNHAAGWDGALFCLNGILREPVVPLTVSCDTSDQNEEENGRPAA